MNGYDATSPSQMLMAFVEGDLDGVNEDLLFSLLSDNHALRLEMRELMAINRLARTDADQLLPPAAWKGNVLAGIAGIRNQSAERDDDSAAGAGWYRGGAIALLSLLLGVFGTLGVLHLKEGGDSSIESPIALSSRSQTTFPAVPTGPPSASNPAAQDRRERSIDQIPGQSKSQVAKVSNRSIPSTEQKSDEGKSLVGTANNDQARVMRSNSLREAPTLTVPLVEDSLLSKPNEQEDGLNILSTSPTPATSTLLDSWKERLEVGYRSNVGARYPNVAVRSTPSDGFSQVSLSVLYKLNNHLRLGLEAGRGEFPQIFRGVENGDLIRYEQNPTLFWYGLACDYTAGEFLLDGLHPFARVIAGGTAAGPLGRGVFGVKFIPEERIALTAGVEGSAMLYEFQKSWFSSRSLGFTYGFSVKF